MKRGLRAADDLGLSERELDALPRVCRSRTDGTNSAADAEQGEQAFTEGKNRFFSAGSARDGGGLFSELCLFFPLWGATPWQQNGSVKLVNLRNGVFRFEAHPQSRPKGVMKGQKVTNKSIFCW